jgi:competence protein ComFC
MPDILDIFFPKTCIICKRKGTYLCSRCRKLFKRNLPECYLCRKLSSGYKTHEECKESLGIRALDRVFVSWEYNSLTSDFLKKYKYGYVYNMSSALSEVFVKSLHNSVFPRFLKDTLLTNVPLPNNRLRERGFNQTLNISETVAKHFNLPFSNSLLRRKNTYSHQSMRDKSEREEVSSGDFYVKENENLPSFKSITIVDDVITTGITLQSICTKLREKYGEDLEINGICMFRGKPYYL